MAAEVSSDLHVGTLSHITHTTSSILPGPPPPKQSHSFGNVCMVCSDTAPHPQVFRRHYGVICCEACKCFFRRTVQMGRDYKCRFGNSCPVGRNAVNMKQICQACRFSRCTKAGMRIDSVKKFPKKAKQLAGQLEKKERMSKQVKRKIVPAITTTKTTSSIIRPAAILNKNGATVITTSSTSSPLPPTTDIKTEKTPDNDFDYESDFEQFKFSIASPELTLYSTVIDNALPKLFSGESLENIHEKSLISTPESVPGGDGSSKKSPSVPIAEKNLGGSTKGSPGMTPKQPSPLATTQTAAAATRGNTTPTSSGNTTEEQPPAARNKSVLLVPMGGASEPVKIMSGKDLQSSLGKRGPSDVNWHEMLAKKQRLEKALSSLTERQHQVQASIQKLSSSPHPPYVPVAPPISRVPFGAVSQVSVPACNGPLTSPTLPGPIPQVECTPYATPHDTPHGTPAPSPLPSPHMMSAYPPLSHAPSTPLHVPTPHNLSQPGTPINGSIPPSPTGYNTCCSTPNSAHYHHSVPSSHLTFFPSQPPPFQGSHGHAFYPSMIQGYSAHPPSLQRVSTPAGMPHIQSISGASYGSIASRNGSISSSVPGSAVTSPVKEEGNRLPSPSFTFDSHGKLTVEEPSIIEDDPLDTTRGSISAPVSRTHSPIFKSKKSLAPKTLSPDTPEASVEEVLESLRLRIRHMFKWAKSEVEGFEDLSQMDQKAILRRTVPELVMLGFARKSVPYDGMLLLGSTGKVIRPTNKNSGVATVAAETLTKLVVPLKVLQMDERELALMKEVVLFNPESNGLMNRGVVRQLRRNRHTELLAYADKNSPGRFGELMCLLPPLYEVGLEVTEQLRLEQFVHEGEARIDALLLMSMINQGGPPDEPLEDYRH